jgi:peptidoglycan hydrolase CwlO-like protein
MRGETLSHSGNQNTDPILYASALTNLMNERNPIQTVVGDIQRMVNVIANLGKTRKMAAMRIEQLETQLARIEQQIAEVNPQLDGRRLNKLR